jgi:hypothetical protein
MPHCPEGNDQREYIMQQSCLFETLWQVGEEGRRGRKTCQSVLTYFGSYFIQHLLCCLLLSAASTLEPDFLVLTAWNFASLTSACNDLHVAMPAKVMVSSVPIGHGVHGVLLRVVPISTIHETFPALGKVSRGTRKASSSPLLQQPIRVGIVRSQPVPGSFLWLKRTIRVNHNHVWFSVLFVLHDETLGTGWPKNGTGEWDQTTDYWFWGPVLYQLSYTRSY